ncbi:MAG: hypothetical protein AAF441_10025 [Pseudomonadota bacterium]
MSDREGKPTYYYAAGKKVLLKPVNGLFAVDDDEIASRLPVAEHIAQIRKVTQKLRGRLALVRPADLTGAALDALRERRAARPVYEAEGALIIPLPEVRIEDDDQGKLDDVRSWLRKHAHLAEITRDAARRIQVRPVSNDPVDALEIANRLTEEVGPAMAQTRFIRRVKSF